MLVQFINIPNRSSDYILWEKKWEMLKERGIVRIIIVQIFCQKKKGAYTM